MKQKLQKYGKKVLFLLNEPVAFPDFTLCYVGDHIKEYPGHIPNKWHYFDFEISNNSSKRTISWSPGTGDISPTYFSWHSCEYVFEIFRSDILGKLKKNEIVIWEQNLYDKKLKMHSSKLHLINKININVWKFKKNILKRIRNTQIL
jgi:hypothetical protein